MEEQKVNNMVEETEKGEQPKQRLSDIAKEFKKEEQPERKHVPIVLAIILFIKYVVENFRGVVGLIGLGFIIIGWLMVMISIYTEGIMMFVVGLILELFVWITGPITIHINKK